MAEGRHRRSALLVLIALVAGFLVPAAASASPTENVYALGTAGFYGSLGAVHLQTSVAAIASTPSGNGYWLMTRQGDVFAFGDAPYRGGFPFCFGSDAVALAPTPTGQGYYILSKNGCVSNYGDARLRSFGSGPIADAVAMSVTPDGGGLWIARADGTVATLGSAVSYGSGLPSSGLPIVGMARTPTGHGYWLLDADGTVAPFGDAADFGSANIDGHLAVGIAAVPDGSGWWVVRDDGVVVSGGNAALFAPVPTSDPPVGIAASPDGTGAWVVTRGVATPVISGKVTVGGAPASACVTFAPEGAAVPQSPYAATDSSGRFFIPFVSPGRYHVRFTSCSFFGPGLRSEWWDDQPFESVSSTVTVDEHHDAVADADLGPGGSIAGIVKNEAGTPLPGVCVYVATRPLSLFPTVTSATGYYRVDGLEQQNHKVLFQDCQSRGLARQWYANAHSSLTATPVPVVAGQLTDHIDATLHPSASNVSGVVRSGGSPLAGACVSLVDQDQETLPSFVPSVTGVVTTTATGYYRFNAMSPGSYLVRFGSCDRNVASFGAQWWDHGRSPGSATTLALDGTNTAGNIDADLSAGGSVSGVVTGPTSNPVAGACVTVVDDSDAAVASTRSTVTGFYRAFQLSSGDYHVRFDDCAGGTLRSQYWSGAVDVSSAASVAVAGGSDTPGVNAQLVPRGSFQGTASDDRGRPVPAVCVDLLQSDGAFAGRTMTSVTGFYRFRVTGYYTVGGHPSAEYAVHFLPDCDGPGRGWSQAVSDTMAVPDGGVAFADGLLTVIVPSRPTSVSASGGNTTAEVRWDTPTSTGGSAITAYQVKIVPSGRTLVVGADHLSAALDSLTNGVPYRFKVRALTAVGPGEWSDLTDAVVPAGVPTAPRDVEATAGVRSADVSWLPPSTDNGTPVTGYTVTASPGGASATAGANDTSATVSGLANGTSYTFTVVATNAVGEGAGGTSNQITTPDLPGAPTNVQAVVVRGGGAATVSWLPPTDNGGRPILTYTVTASNGGPSTTVSAATTSTDITGLTNQVAYTFTVVATTDVGTGPSSAPSNAVTPRGKPARH